MSNTTPTGNFSGKALSLVMCAILLSGTFALVIAPTMPVAAAQIADPIITDINGTNIGYNKGVFKKATNDATPGLGQWTTGNAGSNYREGQWVPYYYEITGITGTSPDFIINFNHYQSNTHAVFIDALSDFRYCVNGDPGCTTLDFGSQDAAFNYPSTWTSFTPAAVNKLYDSSQTTWDNKCANNENPVGTGSIATFHCVKINSLPDTGSAGSANTIRLYFSAHLAKSATWETGNTNTGVVSPPWSGAPVLGADVYSDSDWHTVGFFFGAGGASGSSRQFNLADQTAGSQGAISLPIPTVPLPNLSICGSKFNDLNANAAKNNGEPLLSGWQVYLDLNNNDTYDAGDVLTTTDSSGNYCFVGLDAGTYTVREVNQNGWIQTFPAPVPPGEHSVTLTNQNATAKDFGNYQKQNVTISTTSSPTGNVVPGTSVTDSVTVSGGVGTPTGTVTFYLCNPSQISGGQCPSGGSQVGTSKSLSSGSATSDAVSGATTTTPGKYCWRAEYSGDTLYNAKTHTNTTTECFNVQVISTTLATEIHNGTSHSPDLQNTVVPVNTQVHDHAYITPSNATGNVVFQFFPTANCTGTQIGANQTVALASGSAQSSTKTLSAVGAAYSFKASYLGVSGFSPSSASCEVVRTQFTPTLTTQIHNGTSHSPDLQGTTVPVNTQVHDNATLTNASTSPAPTGNIVFKFYQTSDCTGAILSTNNVAIVSNTAETPLKTLSVAGAAYSFKATYAGDVNNAAAEAACEVVNTKFTPTLTTQIHNGTSHSPDLQGTTVPVNTSVHDNATLTNGSTSPAPTGNIVFKFYSSGNCTGTQIGSDESVAITGTSAETSNKVLNLAGQAYSFKATYAGDSKNEAAEAACEVVNTKFTPSLATEIHAAGDHTLDLQGEVLPVNSSVHDNATLSNSSGSPTGNIVFKFYSSSNCTGTQIGSNESVAITGTSAETSNKSLSTPGSAYSFKATYAGDANNEAAEATCEVVNTQFTPTLTTQIHNGTSHSPDIQGTIVPVNSSVHDNATLSNSSGSPTGNIVFKFYSSSNCTGTQIGSNESVAITGTSAETSNKSLTLGGQAYSFKATYAGDVNNAAAEAACEVVTTNQPPVIETRAIGGTIQAGGTAYDTFLVNGTAGVPTGTVDFFLCGPGQANPVVNGVGCPVGGTFISTEVVNGTGQAQSDNVNTSNLGPGKYCFRTYFHSTSPQYTDLEHTADPEECFNVSVPSGTTRTQGYWQTHLTQVQNVTGANGNDIPSGNIFIVGGSVSGKKVDDLPTLFAAFHSSIAFDENKDKRTSLEKAKMQEMQQLMAAMLNCRAFHSHPGVDIVTGLPIIAAFPACDAPVGTAAGNAINVDTNNAANRAELIRLNGLLGAFNQSGDNQPFPSGFVNSKALPKETKAIAKSVFADSGENVPGLTGIGGFDTKYWHSTGPVYPQPFDI